MSRSSSGKKNDVLNIIKGISGKQLIVEDIDYQFLNESLKKTTYDNHIYISITRNGETLRFVDFVSEPNRKEKKKIINDSHDADLEENIHGIIALGVFKEGASWKWAENCYIIGERRSLVELVQINGRLYRDVAGKESVSTFYFVDRYFDPTSTEDEFLERSNTTFKTVFVSMMIEEILMPPCKITRRTNVVNKITGALEEVVKEYHPILELAGSHDKAITLKKNIIDTFNELSVKELTSTEVNKGGDVVLGKIQDLVKKSIIINLEKNKTYAEESIEDVVKEIYDFTAKRNNAIKNTKPKEALKEPMFDVNDISFDIMDKTPLGLWFACSSGNMGVDGFERLRTAICSGIDAQKQATKEIIDFKEKNWKYPSKKSKDPAEKKMGIRLSTLKAAKQGRGRGKFYPETQEYAKDRGYPDMFDIETEETRKADQINSVKEIIDFKQKNGKWPSVGSKGPAEKKMASKFSHLKTAKQGNGGKLYRETEEYAKNSGYPDMFEVKTEETRKIDQINSVKEIIEFKENNGKYPSEKSKDPAEKKMGQRLSGLKQAEQGRGGRKFYLETQEYAKSRGYPDMFEIEETRKIDQINSVKEIIEFKENNGRWPSTTSVNPSEKVLGKKHSHLKSAKRGFGNCNFYSETQDYAKDRGYPDMFEVGNKKQLGL